MPMASAMLTAASDAIEAFAHTLLRAEKDAKAVVAGGAARRSIDVARAKIAEINADLADMLAANLARGRLPRCAGRGDRPDPGRARCRTGRR